MTDQVRQAGRPSRPDPAGPWREDRGSEPRLTKGEIVRAALDLLKKDGYESFSMRGLATALNIKSPSLYWHVRSKDELFDLVVDAILAECQLPPSGQREWDDQLAEVARELRRVLLGHPAAARLLAGRAPLGPNWLRLAEYILGALRESGFDDQLASYCYLVLLYYAIGFVIQEVAFGTGPVAHERLRQMQDFVRQLPPETYPNLVSMTADSYPSRGLEDRFELGLAGIIGGFASQRRQ
jgi:TetR/AcrR family transcriptional regulator, tetracycline repressor protein